MSKVDIAVIVKIKSDYDSWEKLMLSQDGQQSKIDEGKILYGKANDNTAIVLNFGIEKEDALIAKQGKNKFAELIKDDVESRVFFLINKL
ncbi:hypothetical protein HOD84_04965 [bacterium]|jgi:hypothetical protein|nr:hypothetical protein [bacterium]